MFKKLIEKINFKINSIQLNKRDNALFLDIEIPCSSLEEIVEKSKLISNILDSENILEKENYFLNIYSSGTEKEIGWDELTNHLNKNIFIKLRRNIFKSHQWEGILIDLNEKELILKINIKGLLAKRTFLREDIIFIKQTAKWEKGKNGK
ncbi:MAG: hypothetical protein ACRCRZ_02895 [Metamycoplasmataceae bacterium]